MVFASYGRENISDAQVWDERNCLARLAVDELGFDVIWSVEHHFYDYSFCPDNLQILGRRAPGRRRGEIAHAVIASAAKQSRSV